MKRNNSNKSIEYFYVNSSFFKLLRDTKKYKELYCSYEGKFSIFLAIVTAVLFFVVYYSVDIDTFNEIVRSITLAVIAGLIGVLGFVVGGLAIITGTISGHVVNRINKKGLFQFLIGILFSFYFLGFVIGISLILFSFFYILSFVNSICVTKTNLALLSFILGYLFWFIVWYSIALLGTCIRMFLVNYRFANNDILPAEKQDVKN